jgi:molecular chaperone DnaK
MSPARPTSPARPVPAARRNPAAATRPAVARPPAAAAGPRQRRRSRGFTRFLQVLLSALVLIAAPVVALVFAYSYGTGEPLRDAVTQLVDQLQELLRNGKA